MAAVSIYFDGRSPKADGTCPLKIRISHRGGAAMINLNISVMADEWDENTKTVIRRKDRNFMNSFIGRKLTDVREAVLTICEKSGRRYGAAALRDAVNVFLNPDEAKTATLKESFRSFEALHENKRTKSIYHATWVWIEKFDRHADNLTFEDITKEWLADFFNFMGGHSPSVNARNIHLRNIRAVFNEAIDDEVTTAYPFRKFKIKPVATMKRSLAIKDLRNIFERREDDYMQRYADVFKLSFLLVGINIGDMCLLKRWNVNAGRIEYNRQKTHKLYSIKIEPEAAELIKRYEGKKYLLNFCDSSSYRNFMARTNKNLRKLHEGMTTYWARHSWATVANELDIPDDVIGQALGHSPVSRVTDVYIRRSEKKIDEANRKVIDYVMKNMK